MANATGFYWFLSSASTYAEVSGANTKADGLFDVSSPEAYATLSAGTWTISLTGLTIPDGTYYLYVYAAGDGASYADSPASKSASQTLSSSRTYTYTFNSKSWGSTEAVSSGSKPGITWTSSKDGNSYQNDPGGLQITTGTSGANATTTGSFSNVSSIVVTYCTNASKGAGAIKVKVGTGTEKTYSVTKPSSGGTTKKTATFYYTPGETGVVTLTVDCTANSIYIDKISITAN